MARTQKSPASQPDYLKFFGLSRLPFTRLAEPSDIFAAEQYSLLQAHLANATAETDCLVAVRGHDGSGKTTVLNAYLDSLGDDVFYASIDEGCKTATEFYTAFLRQLGFDDITGTLGELRRIAEQFLQHKASGGKSVLLVIDNAHKVRPVVLEQLRHVAEGVHGGRRVLSVVVAGNSALDRILQSPAMKDLQFRSRVDFNLRVYTESETADYIRSRLDAAGGAKVRFQPQAIALIHRFTGGVPGPINTLCHELLVEACDEETAEISGQMARAVASRLQMLPHMTPLRRRNRRKSDAELAPEEQIAERAVPQGKTGRRATAPKADDTIARLKATLEEAREALSQSEAARKSAVAALKEQQRALQQAHADAEKGRRKYQELELKCDALQASVAELTADLKTADKLGAEFEALEQKLRDKDARIATLTADMAEIARSATATQAIVPEQVDLPPAPAVKRKSSGRAIDRFEISRDKAVERVLAIRDAPPRVMIGRDEHSDLRLDSEFVSRHHALLFISDDGIRIEDLNSFNGTLVNLKKTNRADLQPDDLIVIGDYKLVAKPADG